MAVYEESDIFPRITRQHARNLGLTRYFTGRLCPKKHLCQRNVCDKSCVTCANIRTVKRHNKHPEKHRLAGERYRKSLNLTRPWKNAFFAAEVRARRKNLAFTIDENWYRENWTGFCTLTNLPMFIDVSGKGGGSAYSPSLDRIKPAEGYTPANCRFILHSINCFRGRANDLTMLIIAKALLDKHKNLVDLCL